MSECIRVLVSSCGGGIGIDVAMSLKHSGLNIHVIGMDASEKGMLFGSKVCDEVIKSPLANQPDFKIRINRICKDRDIDIVIFNHSKELREIGRGALEFEAKCLLPECRTILICSDKWATMKKLMDESLMESMAKTSLVSHKDGIAKTFEEFGSPLWLRIPEGSGGRGTLLVEKPEHAINWIEYWRDVKGYSGNWLLQEYLPGRNFNWCSVWYRGHFIASSTMERIEYYMASASVSGVSGAVGVCRIVHDERVHKLGVEAVVGLSEYHHGIFTMDAREDKYGKVKLTEMENRMQGRPRLHTVAGVNLPEIVVRVLAGFPLDSAVNRIDGGVEGTTLYRQLDFEPIIMYEHMKAVVPKINASDKNPLLMWDDEKYGRDLSKLDKNPHGEGREYKWT